MEDVVEEVSHDQSQGDVDQPRAVCCEDRLASIAGIELLIVCL